MFQPAHGPPQAPAPACAHWGTAGADSKGVETVVLAQRAADKRVLAREACDRHSVLGKWGCFSLRMARHRPRCTFMLTAGANSGADVIRAACPVRCGQAGAGPGSL